MQPAVFFLVNIEGCLFLSRQQAAHFIKPYLHSFVLHPLSTKMLAHLLLAITIILRGCRENGGGGEIQIYVYLWKKNLRYSAYHKKLSFSTAISRVFCGAITVGNQLFAFLFCDEIEQILGWSSYHIIFKPDILNCLIFLAFLWLCCNFLAKLGQKVKHSAVRLIWTYIFGMVAMPLPCNGILLIQGNLPWVFTEFTWNYASFPIPYFN